MTELNYDPDECGELEEPSTDWGLSRYCKPDLCEWYLTGDDEPICPHPRACERRGKCLHPTVKVRH